MNYLIGVHIICILLAIYGLYWIYCFFTHNDEDEFHIGYNWAKLAITENHRSPAYVEAQLSKPKDAFEDGARVYLQEYYETRGIK